jgi:hypothetical protein
MPPPRRSAFSSGRLGRIDVVYDPANPQRVELG